MNIQYLKNDSKKSFKKLVGINRDTSPAHVQKLKLSIEQIGMLQAIIVAELSFITGKKELYIIEGQHKYEACMALGIDIPYVIIKGIYDYKALVETIALLNSSSKSWKMEDYILAWGSVNPDYKKLMVLYNKYGVEVNIAAGILSNNESLFSGRSNQLIKQGNFCITNNNAEKHISYTSDVVKQLPKINRTVLRTFISQYVSVLISLGSSYEHDVMLRYINKQKHTILMEHVDKTSITGFFEKYRDFLKSNSFISHTVVIKP